MNLVNRVILGFFYSLVGIIRIAHEKEARPYWERNRGKVVFWCVNQVHLACLRYPYLQQKSEYQFNDTTAKVW